MTAVAMQEAAAGHAWDFSSVFALLESKDSGKRSVSTSPFSNPTTSTAASPLSLIEPPRAKYQERERNQGALGDFTNVLSFLGSSSSSAEADLSSLDITQDVIASENERGVSDFELRQSSTKPILLKRPKGPVQLQETVDKSSPKLVADGRRAILEDFLGSSHKSTSSPSKKKLKEINLSTPLHGDLISSSTSSKTSSSSKGKSLEIATKKKLDLMTQLLKRFPENSTSLKNMKMPITELDPSGVHVFVDISNVCFGIICPYLSADITDSYWISRHVERDATDFSRHSYSKTNTFFS
jgi:hypothetical protein